MTSATRFCARASPAESAATASVAQNRRPFSICTCPQWLGDSSGTEEGHPSASSLKEGHPCLVLVGRGRPWVQVQNAAGRPREKAPCPTFSPPPCPPPPSAPARPPFYRH